MIDGGMCFGYEFWQARIEISFLYSRDLTPPDNRRRRVRGRGGGEGVGTRCLAGDDQLCV